MKLGATEAETLRLNGWSIGDILEGDEGYGPERILITGIGEERFTCRWLHKGCDDFGSESGNTTLRCREWRKVNHEHIDDTEPPAWDGGGLPPVGCKCEHHSGRCSDGYPCGESVAFGERYCDDCPNYAEDSDSESALSQALSMPSKYHVRLKGAWCDVYDVMLAFGVTNPADQHAIKKMLRPGQRGAKDGIQDRREAIQSLHRAIELEGGA